MQGAGGLYKGSGLSGVSDLDVLVRFTYAVPAPMRAQRLRLAQLAADQLRRMGIVYSWRLGERVVRLEAGQAEDSSDIMMTDVDVVLEWYQDQERRQAPDPQHRNSLASASVHTVLRAMKAIQHVHNLPRLNPYPLEEAALVVVDDCCRRLGSRDGDTVEVVLPQLLLGFCAGDDDCACVTLRWNVCQAWYGAARLVLKWLLHAPGWVIDACE